MRVAPTMHAATVLGGLAARLGLGALARALEGAPPEQALAAEAADLAREIRRRASPDGSSSVRGGNDVRKGQKTGSRSEAVIDAEFEVLS